MHRIFRTSVASVYPLYVTKLEKKGRTKDELDEIISILQGAEICRPVKELQFPRPGEVCTMIYTSPYATLTKATKATDEIKLGERTNGCAIPSDLCGNAAQDLRGYLQNLKDSLETRELCASEPLSTE